MTNQTQEKPINEVVKVEIDDSTLTHIDTALNLTVTVKDLKISNNDEYINAGQFLKKIKGVSKLIDDSRKEITTPLNEIKNRVMEFFNSPLKELSQAEFILKKAIIGYQQEQDRILRQAEQKAIERAMAEERKKIKALEERAKKEEKKGNPEKAEMLKERAADVYVPTVVQAPTIEKVQGISTKKVWKARIIDFSSIPKNYYINDEKVQAAIQAIVNKLATATKGAMPIQGVEFYLESTLSASRG